MDIIRTPIEKEIYYLLCDITVNLNDSRFLVKKKINALSESNLKEQKGYKKRCINIIINADNNVFILFLGAIRYYSLFYDEVYVYIKNVENYNNEFVDPYIHIMPLHHIESYKDNNHDYIIVSDNNANKNIDIDKKIAHTYFINKKKYNNEKYKETSDMFINEIYQKLDLEPSIGLEY